MTKDLRGPTFALCLLAAMPGLASAETTTQTTAPTEVAGTLPIDRVVLSTAGVGFFQHGGQVNGDTTVELRFTPSQLNDLLKSLVVQDFDGGVVSSVAYPSQEPLERLLGSFAINLSGNPSLPQLFEQLRGAEIQLALEGGDQLVGRILGTETRMQMAGESAIETVFVSLASPDGLRAVELASIRRFQLADPQLQAELDKALGALAESRHADRKPVSLRFTGEGTRRVAIGYVVEAPIWKASYRLVLPAQGSEAKPVLQGWAIIENTTEHDWRGVELALVSGRPLSFIEDLYQPQYIARPVHAPQRFAALGPQRYEAGMAETSDTANDAIEAAPRAKASAPAQMMRLAAPAPAPAIAEATLELEQADRSASIDISRSVRNLAQVEDLGATIQYVVRAVDIPRQRSAMLPIVATSPQAIPLSIYDHAVLASHPLRGVRLSNTTDQPLPGGPLTVLEGNSYAGDARIEHLPAGAERLISFAVDLPVSVQRRDAGTETSLAAARLERGVLQLQHSRVRTTTYAIKNEAGETRHLILAHPVSAGWELAEPKTPDERTESQYRFGFDVAPDQGKTFSVRETRVDLERVQIGRLDERSLLSWSSNSQLPRGVREALTRAAELQRAISLGERAVAAPLEQINAITTEQQRIRDNLATLERGTPLHQRLIAKLNTQESELEQLQAKQREAQQKLEAARKAFEDFLASLSIG